MSNYTQLGLIKQTDGENEGTWGDKLNDSLIDLLDDAIGGYVEVSVASGNVTLAFADGTADNNGRHAVIKFTGSPGTTRTVTFPDAQVNYFIINGSDGSVICTSGSGAATVTIPTGMKDIIYVDGSDEILSMLSTPNISGNVTIGVDDTGYDVKFFGATSGAYMLWDESADDLVLAGAAGIDLAGDIDVDGTANLDAVDIDGAVQIDNTITVGADDQGYDVKFFGDTASAYMLWDTSADDLVLAGAAGIDLAGDIDVDGTANLDAVDIDGATQMDGTVTVGVDDTGYDVKFFGASAGAYALWDESANLLDLRGATAAGPGHLKLTTGELTVVDGDKLGRIDFQAPLEADGTDAILVAASIYAEADDTFAAGVNNTDLVFALGKSETAAEKFRFTADGEIGIGGANYGSDGQVLTSAGAGAAAAWESIPSASVTSYTNSTDNRIITSVDSSTINGEANLTFTGSALTCIGTMTVGVDDAGHDVKFFGATASKYMEWDESADTLNVAGTIAIPAGGAITNAGTMAPDITSTGKAMVLGF